MEGTTTNGHGAPGAAHPVRPIAPAARALPYLLVLPLVAGLAFGLHFLVSPRVATHDDGRAIVYAVERSHTVAAAVALGVAALAGAALAAVLDDRRAPRLRYLGGAGCALAVVLLFPTWSYHAARVELTPDALTAGEPSGLLPGKPITLQFDDVGAIRFGDRKGGWVAREHTWYARNGRPTRFELGPLRDATIPAIAAIAKSRGAAVEE